ncbi:hypothetical protein GCM10009754_04350 [Amycolatopsis minnesotensis]|uniref:Uncharacterized protein n=1 Tax=Amycolatopsis minnesotensis TaxID=337894 RepID=A0ABN2Q0M7_9PSEU
MEKFKRFGCDVWEWGHPDTRWKYQAIHPSNSGRVALWCLAPSTPHWRPAYEEAIAPGRTAGDIVAELHERTTGGKP